MNERTQALLERRGSSRLLLLSAVSLLVASCVWSEQRVGEVADTLLSVGVLGFVLVVFGPGLRWLRPPYVVALLATAVQLAYVVAGLEEALVIQLLPFAAVPVAYVSWRGNRAGRLAD